MSEEERNGLIKQRRLLRKKCKQKDKEIDRLNNIINELEKWVKEDVKEEKSDLYFQVLRKIDILDKLKELKNGDNNE